MRGSPRAQLARGTRDLEKYASVGALSEGQLLRLIEWDRPHQLIRRAPLVELLGKPPPTPWSEQGAERSSEALFALGKFLIHYAGDKEDGDRFRGAIDLLQNLCDARPEAARTVVWPAVRCLDGARRRGDRQSAEALEGVLLHLARKAPAVVVSGILNAANPRYRGNWKKGRDRWRKKQMIRSITGASRILREAFIVPATDRLNQEGYPSVVAILSQIEHALESVIRAAKEPSEGVTP